MSQTHISGKLSNEISYLTKTYVSKGDASSRNEHVKKMKIFASWVEENYSGIGSLHRVGQKHVIAFYRSRRNKGISYRTNCNYDRPLRELWRLLKKSGDPPKPIDVAKRHEATEER